MDAKETAELEALVLEFFSGDAKKTALWFETKNPLLGGISPNRMIVLGRHDKLLKWAKEQIAENHRPDVKVCNKPVEFEVSGKKEALAFSCPKHLGAIAERLMSLHHHASVYIKRVPNEASCDFAGGR